MILWYLMMVMEKIVSSGNIFEQKEKILPPLFDKLMVFDRAWSLGKKQRC